MAYNGPDLRRYPPLASRFSHFYKFADRQGATQFENSVSGAAQPLVMASTSKWRLSRGGALYLPTTATDGAFSAATASLTSNRTLSVYLKPTNPAVLSGQTSQVFASLHADGTNYITIGSNGTNSFVFNFQNTAGSGSITVPYTTYGAGFPNYPILLSAMANDSINIFTAAVNGWVVRSGGSVVTVATGGSITTHTKIGVGGDGLGTNPGYGVYGWVGVSSGFSGGLFSETDLQDLYIACGGL
jgi:hypothetical protein